MRKFMKKASMTDTKGGEKLKLGKQALSKIGLGRVSTTGEITRLTQPTDRGFRAHDGQEAEYSLPV